jgi:arsenate reductase-like glutaredoxin family protein
MSSKFAFTHKLQKKDVLILLNELSDDEIKNIVSQMDKTTLVNIFKCSFSKSQLQEILYNSTMTTKKIMEYLYTDAKNATPNDN